MSDTATLEDGRFIADLKVVELRDELGKRGLSKTGNKQQLADRLRGFIATGTGEVSEKSASNSPVKSPVNSLIAQYRSTQQQLLKDAQKEPEPLEQKEEVAENVQDEVAENGHKEMDIQINTVEQEVEIPAKEHSPVTEPEQQQMEPSPMKQETLAKEENEPSPMEADEESKEEKEPSPVQEFTTPQLHINDEKTIEEEIPKALTPIADRERSKTPERELPSPPTTNEANVVISEETLKPDTIDRAISEEPADDEEERESTPPRKSVHQVTGNESDNESQNTTPKSQSSESKNQQEKHLNGNDKRSSDENDLKMHADSDGNHKKSEVYTEGIVYVNDEVVTPKPKTSVVSQSNDEGLIRHKSVSPAKCPPSNFIYIRGLRRPFTVNQFHAVLLKFGTFTKDVDEWMDSLRSQSIIKYSTVEEAQKARDGLHHVVWPEFNNSELLVDFTDEAEFIQQKGVLKKVIKPENDVSPVEKSLSPNHDDLPSPKENIKREREQDDDTDEGPSPKKKKEKKSLEELFRRTIAQPLIYYLPLSDEEVARKQVQKAIEKREIKDTSEPILPPLAASSSSLTVRREKSPSPLPPVSRQKSRSPLKRSGQISPRRRSPPRRNRDGPPPRHQRSPRRSSPPSKRRSPSPRRSPPSSRKPATASTSSPSGIKTTASPFQRRRSPSPPPRRRSPSPRKR